MTVGPDPAGEASRHPGRPVVTGYLSDDDPDDTAPAVRHLRTPVATSRVDAVGRSAAGGGVTVDLWDDEPDLGELLSAPQAQNVLGIPAQNVRKWASRGKNTGLCVVGSDPRGYPMYYEADLIALSRGMKIRDEDGNRVLFEIPTEVKDPSSR